MESLHLVFLFVHIIQERLRFNVWNLVTPIMDAVFQVLLAEQRTEHFGLSTVLIHLKHKHVDMGRRQ
jgi:hypothetical protein